MEPPQEPSIEDCCNSGCNPCIFDVYEKQMILYRSNNKNRVSPELKENGISQLKYTIFKIVGMITLSSAQKELRLRRTNQDGTHVWWRPGDHFLYKHYSEHLSCTRAYTPIKLASHKNEDYDFLIVIKCYDSGLVSKHLFQLEIGDLTQWRGPYGSYIIKRNTFKRIVMIAQGTGIAPFISIIESILNNEDDMSNIILYYCSQSVDDILFRDELNLYKSYWNFSYAIFLSSNTNTTKIKYREPIITRRFAYEDLSKLKPCSSDQFLLCGSSQFMKD